ncbi:MAG: HD domain-containing protein [Chloroflexi bacterium]|nr:MAG: HD domain-containing protein [Chloroflexota bacterium]
MADQMSGSDGAHKLDHVHRVVKSAKQLAAVENADLSVVIPAAWLHDCVIMPKDSWRRNQASQMAAKAAGGFLQASGYETELIPAIEHAIAAHSFSAKIPPETIEAKVVQDADRLDAIGAIGIARCIIVGASFGRPLYHPDEPFAQQRQLDDKQYSIDHFYVKLFKLLETMQTDAGRAEAERRTQFMRDFLAQLKSEIE